MHILLIHQYFLEEGQGGGSRWNDFSRIWTAAGHQVTVLAGNRHYMGLAQDKGPFSFKTTVNSAGVKVIRCPVSGGSNFVKRVAGYFSFAFSCCWAGIFHATERYDLIITTSPPLFVALPALVLSFFKRIPFLFEVRDLWPESAIGTGLLSNPVLIRIAFWFEKLIYKKAWKVTVLTPAFHTILCEKGVGREKLLFIPNAADFQLAEEVALNFDRDDFRQRHGLENKFVLVYAGAHGIANHLIQLIESMEMLRDPGICLLLIGDGSEKRALMSHCGQRNLDQVKFFPAVPKKEVLKFVLAADMGISVLKNAGIFKTIYSNKTFDYFSCKKPVLMVIDGISRQLVEDANAGIYAEPENPEDIAAKIRQCADGCFDLDKMGENGFRLAKTHFDREKLAEEYLNKIKVAAG